MYRKVLLSLFALLIALSFSRVIHAADEPQKPVLTPADCVKCHTSQPADIAANGSKHKTSINCQNCHTAHRPGSQNNIPVCNKCHGGKPHFEQKNCLQCHKNPHTPLKITFDRPMTEPCLACHTNQIKQLRENKSKHSAKNCTDCHDMHRKIPKCTQCHKPHSKDITAENCRECHKPHMPKVVTYAGNVDSKFCSACHKRQYDSLQANVTKHTAQNCATCHQDKHKMIPNCKDCHGEMHPTGIMLKYPKCLECHKSPHDLNNWKAVEPQQQPKKKPLKKRK